MILWIFSFITGLVIIFTLYFALKLANKKLRITSVIVLILMLVGETYDILGMIVLDEFKLLYSETLELFVAMGFLVMLYYIYEKRKKIIKINKKKKSKRKKKK